MFTALIISRSFPPVGSVGASIRVVKLIKYISRCSWKFIVLTQHPDHTVVAESKISAHMLEEIPPDTSIVRVPAPISPIMPKSSFWWGCCVFWRGIKQCRTQRVDLIYITTPPFIPALIGTFLSKFTRKPLILDIKDDGKGDSTSADFARMRDCVEEAGGQLLVTAQPGQGTTITAKAPFGS